MYNSSWDRDNFGMKNGTKHVMYCWKVTKIKSNRNQNSLENQRIHVDTRESVF